MKQEGFSVKTADSGKNRQIAELKKNRGGPKHRRLAQPEGKEKKQKRGAGALTMGFGPVSAAGRLALAELDREDAAHADAVNGDGRSPPVRSRDGNRHDGGGGPARTSTGQDEEAGNEQIGAWGTRIRRRT